VTQAQASTLHRGELVLYRGRQARVEEMQSEQGAGGAHVARVVVSYATVSGWVRRVSVRKLSLLSWMRETEGAA
jgi:translation elongation factor P/translation initiation factor 5A